MEAKQKALGKASGVATPEVRLSREEKGKMPTCSNNAVSCEDTRATVPPPNSRSVAPRASLVLTSEATVPRCTRGIHTCEAQVKAPQRAPPSGSSSAKLALCGGVKGSSLSVDNVTYAASALKGTPKVPSREARTQALLCANPLCGDKRSRTSSYA